MVLRKFPSVFLLLSGFVGVAFCAKTVVFWNRLGEPTWIAGQADGHHPLPNGGGWSVAKGKRVKIELPDSWKGRFWPRTWCNYTLNGFCETGTCTGFRCRGENGNEPHTTVEFTMRKSENDEYTLSFEHGFNTKLKISPQDPEEVDSDGVLCPTIGCEHNFIESCPQELLKHADDYSFGCRSACDVFGEDQYCCRGEYQQAGRCDSRDWPTDYAGMYKQRCPRAKSYRQDVLDTVHYCRALAYLVEITQ